jgi:hypothetical protein
MKLEFFQNIFERYSNTNFMTNRPVGAEFFHSDGRTDRNDEANSHFPKFYKSAQKVVSIDFKIFFLLNFTALLLPAFTHQVSGPNLLSRSLSVMNFLLLLRVFFIYFNLNSANNMSYSHLTSFSPLHEQS